MKSVIIYFSQTGNTRRIANCIQDGIIDVTGQCDLVTLNNADVASLGEYGVVGIGSPVFYYKEPFNVQYFIDSLPQLKGQHWFVFCTHGSVIGNFFPSMERRLKGKGATVIGYFNSYGNLAVPYYPNPSFTAGHPDDFDFEHARTFGRIVGERSPQIAHRDNNLISVSYPVSSEEWVREADKLTAEYLGKIMPQLNVDKDKCTKCHICEKECPVQGLNLGEDPPRIQTPCVYCYHCVNICPVLAISADWDKLVSIAPTYYDRYRKELDRAAARGEFRWLIDPATINFNDPYYKQRERRLKEENNRIFSW